MERQIFGGRGNFPRQVMSQNYGANLASSSVKGGMLRRWENMRARKGRISNLHSRRGRGGLERDPHRPTTTTRPKGGGGGGSHIPVLFSRCSLIVIATAEREGKGYLSNPGKEGREGRCLCCLREQQGEEDLAASRAFWGGREEGWTKRPVDYAADPATLSVAG